GRLPNTAVLQPGKRIELNRPARRIGNPVTVDVPKNYVDLVPTRSRIGFSSKQRRIFLPGRLEISRCILDNLRIADVVACMPALVCPFEDKVVGFKAVLKERHGIVNGVILSEDNVCGGKTGAHGHTYRCDKEKC